MNQMEDNEIGPEDGETGPPEGTPPDGEGDQGQAGEVDWSDIEKEKGEFLPTNIMKDKMKEIMGNQDDEDDDFGLGGGFGLGGLENFQGANGG